MNHSHFINHSLLFIISRSSFCTPFSSLFVRRSAKLTAQVFLSQYNFRGDILMSKQEDANLILKLYELRREPVMREARNWFMRSFNPQSVEEIMQTVRGEHSAYVRMVLSYWDMACSFVTHGAIDEQMFNDANGEHNAVFAKIEPFVEQIREVSKNPKFAIHLEKVVMSQPNAQERLAHLREMFKQLFSAQSQAAR
jgi:hypothetical protein